MGYYFAISPFKIRITSAFIETLLRQKRIKDDCMGREEFREYFKDYCKLKKIKKIKIRYILLSMKELKLIRYYTEQFIIFKEGALNKFSSINKYNILQNKKIENPKENRKHTSNNLQPSAIANNRKESIIQENCSQGSSPKINSEDILQNTKIETPKENTNHSSNNLQPPAIANISKESISRGNSSQGIITKVNSEETLQTISSNENNTRQHKKPSSPSQNFLIPNNIKESIKQTNNTKDTDSEPIIIRKNNTPSTSNNIKQANSTLKLTPVPSTSDTNIKQENKTQGNLLNNTVIKLQKNKLPEQPVNLKSTQSVSKIKNITPKPEISNDENVLQNMLSYAEKLKTSKSVLNPVQPQSSEVPKAVKKKKKKSKKKKIISENVPIPSEVNTQMPTEVNTQIPIENNTSVPTSKVEQTKYFSKEKCVYCDCKFKNKSEFSLHARTAPHKLRHTYRTNKKELMKSTDLVIESANAKEGSKELDLLGDEGIEDRVTLTIKNNTNLTYNISDIIRLYTKLVTEVSFAKQELPIILEPKSHHSITIKFRFPNEGAYVLPIVFKANNESKNESMYILKEVFFFIKPAFADVEFLQQTNISYARQNKFIINLDGIEIINGIKPPSDSTGNLKPVKTLGQYHLPYSMTNILNCGFKNCAKLSNRDQEYWRGLQKLLRVKDSSNPLTKDNYCEMLTTLLYFEENQMINDIHEYDCENQVLHRVPNSINPELISLEVPGLAENRPSLIRGDNLIVQIPRDSVAYRGYVHRVQKTSVHLGFHTKFVTEVHNSMLRYNVTFGFNRKTIRSEHQAVDLVKTHHVHKLFFPDLPATPTNRLSDITFNWRQTKIRDNEQQKQAVKHIISGTSFPAPYLLFGPPGTGKTMTIVEAIFQLWCLKPNCRILVAAPSNSAANEITKRLVKLEVPKEDLFRMIGVSFDIEKVENDIRSHCNYREGEYYYPDIDTVESYRIIIVTLSTAAKLFNGDVKPGYFEYVFIDESGHSTEPEVLIPIAGIITAETRPGKLLGQIVLAGDPEQLGPIIRSKLAKEYGFEMSMLERLMRHCDVYKKKHGKYDPNMVTKLLKNFRSHPAILELPNEMFYENELEAQGKDKVDIALGWNYLPNRNFPLIFHNVLGQDEREENSPSFYNTEEIEVVMGYLELLVNKELNGKIINELDIGVVSPYRKQCHKLQIRCRKRKWENVLIGSVEQFQGQERLIIIISTVRSRKEKLEHDYQFGLGFLRNPKRFNVAITRAKALVIVIGNANILQWDPHWGAFIEYCKDNNALEGDHFEFKQSWLKYDLENDNNNEPSTNVFNINNNLDVGE